MSAAPWRTFRWRAGQVHYSGTYWCATTRDHVIYESRLELARLLFADYDRTVLHVIAQPFLLRASVKRRIRRHVPDYLLFTDGIPTVVDVKPVDKLSAEKVRFTLDWTRELVEQRGWLYEVWTAFSGISPHFRPRRHLLSATELRTEMTERFAVWDEVTAPDTAA